MEYRIADGLLMIEPGEEIDQYQAEQVLQWTRSLLVARQIYAIIFDMRHTVFMDSAGVGMLMALYREMMVRGGIVGVMHLQGSLARIYRVAGLAKIVTCFEDEQAVMAALHISRGCHYEG